jgi:hypothetical protein
MRASAAAEREITRARKEHEQDLLDKANVVGIGVGEKETNGRKTGQPSLIVYVNRKVEPTLLAARDVIPATIDGVTTDVIEVGDLVIQANTSRMRPAIAGISIAHAAVTAGTLGCLLRSEADGQLYILSNNHVLADMNRARFGDNILQPGPLDGGSAPGDVIGTVFRFPAVDRTGTGNLVDCTLASPNAAGDVQAVTLDAWSDVKAVPGWFGAENQGADIALADINGSGRMDLVVFHVDNPEGENHGYYRIGFDLEANGNVTGGWSDIKSVPGWFGAEDQGAGIAVADISGNGRPDLLVFHLDNPEGENVGYYRIGWNLDGKTGDVTGGWSDVRAIPGWFGAENQGGAVAVADVNGDGTLDLVVFHLDNPEAENTGYYRIGWNLDAGGFVTAGWSPVMAVPGWFGAENQGAGIAVGDFTGASRPELIVYHVDNPEGENIAHFRIGRDLATDGTVASWSEIRQVSGWVGSETQGGGLAAGDINGDGLAELACVHIDNPTGENQAYYKVSLNRPSRSGDFVNRLGGWIPAGLGMRVWKSGRTTELTNGSITDVGGTFDIGDGAGGRWGVFNDQLGIRPAISKPGDSGSVVVDALNHAVGLLFAGSSEITIVNRIEHVLEALRYSDVRPVPGWFGAENQGADIAVADVNGNGQPDLVVFHVDNPEGENHGYFRVGWNLDGNAAVGTWSDIKAVPGWFGAEDQGAGIALADVNGNGQQDLIVFHVDNPEGENQGYYRVGFNLDNNGDVAGGWSEVKAVPGWFGAEDQGTAIAVGDINGSGRPDLVVFHVDNPGGDNAGYYRIGWNLDANGDATGGWSEIIAVPGWFGWENQGAGIALVDLTGNGRLDLLVFHIDNPDGENHGFYRVGFDINDSGNAEGGWSDPIAVPGWFGAEDQGAGIAVTRLQGNARPALVVFHVDNPDGENHGFYRTVFDLMPNGVPARWDIA